jgi:hypothetical protein
VREKWIFSSTSRSFGYGYEAVRIRVQSLIAQINSESALALLS